MVSNELRAAAANFRAAMAIVSAARDRLAEAVSAEAEAPIRTSEPAMSVTPYCNCGRG